MREDIFGGSGTTMAVAHKMKRQYIGIEQMDYIETIPVERLKKVIQRESGGISQAVNWQGGGNFVYAELNSVYVRMIEQAANSEELLFIALMMKEKAHLNYQISVYNILNQQYEIDEVSYLMSFQSLSLNEQKQILIGLLDKNQLYACASEKDDAALQLSEHDCKYTKC